MISLCSFLPPRFFSLAHSPKTPPPYATRDGEYGVVKQVRCIGRLGVVSFGIALCHYFDASEQSFVSQILVWHDRET